MTIFAWFKKYVLLIIFKRREPNTPIKPYPYPYQTGQTCQTAQFQKVET